MRSRSSPRRRRCDPRLAAGAARAVLRDALGLGALRRDLRGLLAGPGRAAGAACDERVDSAESALASMQRLAAPAAQGSPDHVEAGDGQDGDRSADRREHATQASTRRTAGGRRTCGTSSIPQEIAQAHALAERLAHRMRARLVRREQARRRGRRLDLRRTIHRSISPWRHADRSGLAPAQGEAAAAGRAARRLRLDGASTPRSSCASCMAWSMPSARPRRSCSTRGSRMSRPSLARPRRRARGRHALADGAGHRRRHAHRRVPGDLQSLACASA